MPFKAGRISAVHVVVRGEAAMLFGALQPGMALERSGYLFLVLFGLQAARAVDKASVRF